MANERQEPPFETEPGEHWYDPDEREQPRPNGNGKDHDTDLPVLHFYGEPDDRPLRAWAVADLMEASCLVIISGSTGTGKTFLSIELVSSFITGMNFAKFEVKRTGGVLFVAAETPEQVRPRIEAMVLAKVKPYYDNRGEPMPKLPIAWVEEVEDISTPAGYAKLQRQAMRAQAAMRERFGCDLVAIVIDTTSAATPNYKINDPQESSRLYAAMQALRRSTNTVLWMTDHFGKDPDRGTSGSAQKEQKVDTVLYTKESGITDQYELKVQKVRNARARYSLGFVLKDYPLPEVDADGRKITSKVVNWLNGGEEISQDTGKRGRPASNLPLVLQAINRALNDHGQLRPTRDGERNTVTWQQAVDCYLELTPPEDDDPEADALKAERKFREAVNGKSGRDVIGFQAAKKRDKSEALLWLLHRSRV